MEKNIEVEIRSFISKDEYNRLSDFFIREGKMIEEDNQETFYFSGDNDLRIQKNDFGSKITFKQGRVHDERREETEIKFFREDFNKLESLFLSLGYEIEIKWFRHRKEFDWQGIRIDLDFTKGYGYIIELEKMCLPDEQVEVLRELKIKLGELDIALTSREEFERKFEEYKNNWRELIKD